MDHPEHANEAFTRDILERIAHIIADVEQTTGAEIRVSVRDLRDAGEADLSLKELAQKEFATLHLHHHDKRLGILLLVLYHERKFYVYGDEGVHSKIHPEAWDDVAKTLGAHFAKSDYEGGLREALKKIEHHLKGKLPKNAAPLDHAHDEVVMS
jgi:uncharacterized membrane protein